MSLNSYCHCCLLRPPDKSLKTPYTALDKTEIYANMFKECFEIQLFALSTNDDCGICEVCVGRLRDASDFKLQVQRSQAELQRALHVKEEGESVKPEMFHGDLGQVEVIVEIKTEAVDPLPMVGEDDYKFMPDLEYQASAYCKQELTEVPIKLQLEYPDTKPKSDTVEETFKNFIKLGKRRNNTGRTKNTKIVRKAERVPKQNRQIKNTCEICNKEFKYQSQLIIHSLVHTKVKLFNCEICYKPFSDKSALNKHKRVHSEDKPYSCDICKAEFKYKPSLYTHILKHMRKRVSCEYCSKIFSGSERLQRHIKRSHEKSNYICDECKRVFKCKSELITHFNIHTKWITYPCDFCGMKLSTMGSLQRHKLVHAQERVYYPCEFCDKTYRFKHGLNAHLRVHTGEKPYCCEVCGKRFGQTSNLKKHLEIHVQGVTYACEFCSKSYSTSEGLRQHKRTHTKNRDAIKSISKSRKTKECQIGFSNESSVL